MRALSSTQHSGFVSRGASLVCGSLRPARNRLTPVALNRYPGLMTAHVYPTVVSPPGAAAPPAAMPAPPAPAWAGPGQPPPPPPRRHQPVLLWVLAAVAAVSSVAALVLGGVALNKASQSAAPVTTTMAAPAPAPLLFDDAADRTLCEAIPDLMRERDEADRTYQALPAGSPERNAAIPAYKAGVQDWARRMEKLLAAHAQPDRYLTRTLQRYIDDMLLYAQNIYANKPADPFDKPTWDTGVVDYGGALGRCSQLGIHW
jgi:hypothetical protein